MYYSDYKKMHNMMCCRMMNSRARNMTRCFFGVAA